MSDPAPLASAQRERLACVWQGLNLDTHTAKTGGGALVDGAVICRQLVAKTAAINVLYNYRPIETGEGVSLHFLLVPKPDRPAKDFSELELDQYQEVLSGRENTDLGKSKVQGAGGPARV